MRIVRRPAARPATTPSWSPPMCHASRRSIPFSRRARSIRPLLGLPQLEFGRCLFLVRAAHHDQPVQPVAETFAQYLKARLRFSAMLRFGRRRLDKHHDLVCNFLEPVERLVEVRLEPQLEPTAALVDAQQNRVEIEKDGARSSVVVCAHSRREIGHGNHQAMMRRRGRQSLRPGAALRCMLLAPSGASHAAPMAMPSAAVRKLPIRDAAAAHPRRGGCLPGKAESGSVQSSGTIGAVSAFRPSASSSLAGPADVTLHLGT